MKAVLSMYVLDSLTHIEDNMPDWGLQTITELSPEFPKAVYWVETDWSGDSVTWTYPWEMNGGDFDNRRLARNDNETILVWEEYDLTDAVKELVAGTRPNYGFFVWPLAASLQDHYGVTYASSEFADQALRPKLTITTDGTENSFAESKDKFNTVQIVRGTCRIHNPFNETGTVSITDVRGRRILVKEFVEEKSSFVLPDIVSEGVYVVSVQARERKVVSRVSFIK